MLPGGVHPHRVRRTRRQVPNQGARRRGAFGDGAAFGVAVVLCPRLPLHHVAAGVRGRIPDHPKTFDAGRHRDPRHLARRRLLRRSGGVGRGRPVGGGGMRRDDPHGVLGACGQAGDGVAGAGRCRLSGRRVVVLRPRFPLHLVAAGPGHRRPGDRKLAHSRRHRDAGHLARPRRRRSGGVGRGRPVGGVLPGGDDPYGVRGASRQPGDGVAGAGRRRLPGRRVVVLRPRLPLHLVAVRSGHRRPGDRKLEHSRGHRDAGHLARGRRRRRSSGVGGGRPVGGVLPGGVHPHGVRGARGQSGDGVAGRAAAGDDGTAVRVAVALRPRLPLHHVAVGVRGRRPGDRKLAHSRRHRDPRHLSRGRRRRRAGGVGRGRPVGGVGAGGDDPHGVCGARGQAGDGVAGGAAAGYDGAADGVAVALRPRLPLHHVAVGVRGCGPGHRQAFDAGRHRDPRHLARWRHRRRVVVQNVHERVEPAVFDVGNVVVVPVYQHGDELAVLLVRRVVRGGDAEAGAALSARDRDLPQPFGHAEVRLGFARQLVAGQDDVHRHDQIDRRRGGGVKGERRRLALRHRFLVRNDADDRCRLGERLAGREAKQQESDRDEHRAKPATTYGVRRTEGGASVQSPGPPRTDHPPTPRRPRRVCMTLRQAPGPEWKVWRTGDQVQPRNGVDSGFLVQVR